MSVLLYFVVAGMMLLALPAFAKYIVVGLIIVGTVLCYFGVTRVPRDGEDRLSLDLMLWAGTTLLRIDGALFVLWALYRFWKSA